jgi:capsular polysaccharide biosynthesis protein
MTEVKTLFSSFVASSIPVLMYKEALSGQLVSTEYRASHEIGSVQYHNPESSYFSMASRWGNNYYHWLFDIFATYLLAKEAGERVSSKIILLGKWPGETQHVHEWLEFAGVSKINYVDSIPYDAAKVIFREQYKNRIHPLVIKALLSFRPQLEKRYERDCWPRYLLLQRGRLGTGASQSRNLENRVDIISYFARRGINLAVVYLEGTSVVQQMCMFSHAELVIAAHGAGLANIVFCNNKCRIVEIASPIFYNPSYVDLASRMGLNFVSLLGSLSKENTDTNASLVINPVLLWNVLFA